MTDDLLETLREIVARLQAQGIEYMLVGSIAALAHGRSRSTQAFDVVIDATVAQLRRLLRSLPEDRFYASEDAAMESVRHQTQFNVIDMRTGWKADIIPKKRRTFSEVEFERRAELSVLGQLMQVASLEDTIIAKLEWAKMGGGIGASARGRTRARSPGGPAARSRAHRALGGSAAARADVGPGARAVAGKAGYSVAACTATSSITGDSTAVPDSSRRYWK